MDYGYGYHILFWNSFLKVEMCIKSDSVKLLLGKHKQGAALRSDAGNPAVGGINIIHSS